MHERERERWEGDGGGGGGEARHIRTSEVVCFEGNNFQHTLHSTCFALIVSTSGNDGIRFKGFYDIISATLKRIVIMASDCWNARYSDASKPNTF